MNHISRRRLIQLGLLTPLAPSPFYRQPTSLAACVDGKCSNPTQITASTPTSDIPLITNFIWPIVGAPNNDLYKVGDAFGPRLISKKYSWHEGIDIKAEEGTDVIACCSGFVRISADCDERYLNSGKIIQIECYKYDDNNNIQHYRVNYHHLSQRLVRPGDIIRQGTVIGKSGCTGAAWAHLHLEIRRNNIPQNPYSYLAGSLPKNHTVTIQNIINTNGMLQVDSCVTSPWTKLDINRIKVLALDSNNKELDSMYVDFNANHNCGRISSSNDVSYTYTESLIKQVTIKPYDFSTNHSEWRVNFNFSGLSSSNATKIKVEALDCSNQIAEDTKTI
ncbi:MAG: M23 family metallopeptidase [Nostoc sp. TH1S01]|nr:M23 family metallopeptidase [Nostoc sp. TH1S01]